MRALRSHTLRLRKSNVNHKHCPRCCRGSLESHSDWDVRRVRQGRGGRPITLILQTKKKWRLGDMKALAQADSATRSESGTGSQASLSTEAPRATAQESLLVPAGQAGRESGRASGKTGGWCSLKGEIASTQPNMAPSSRFNLVIFHLFFGALPLREFVKFPVPL